MLKVGLFLMAAVSVAAGYVMGPSQYRFPDPQQDKTKFGFEDIWNFYPAKFSGQWFGENLVYQNQDSDVLSRENGCKDGHDTVLMKGELLREWKVSTFYPSPDLSEILLASDVKKVWRHSFTAVYHVYNVETKNVTHVGGEGRRLQYCRWAPAHGRILFVVGNDVYYMKHTHDLATRITQDGQPNTVFNGIPDWMYEEDVLSEAVAHYWSPDAQFFIFAKFNDTLVPKIKFKMFGDQNDVYGRIEEIAYPKAGDIMADDTPGAITAATLHLVDLSSSSPYTIRNIQPPTVLHTQDHYFTRVAWLGDGIFTVTWTNRVQNHAVVQTCEITNATGSSNFNCFDHLAQTVTGGWIDSPWPSPVVLSSDTYVIPLSKPEGDSGTWKHAAVLNAKNTTVMEPEMFLTEGQMEVLSIRAYDGQMHDIYYLGTGGDPTKRHLYKISVKNSSASPVCVSCSVGPACQYVSASFSKSADNYILSCHGPDIPSYSVRSTRDDSVWVVEDNKNFRDKVNKKLMPTREFMEVEVGGGYKTQAEIFKPPGFDPKKKYPLLIFAYAGPGSQRVMQTYVLGSSQRNWMNFMRSSHDVVVASVDSRGAAARGDKYKHELYRRLGTVEVDDQINFAKHLKEKLGYIDNSKKAAIFGWSYGGMTASHVLAEANDTIQCGLAVAPTTSRAFYDSAHSERYMGLATSSDNKNGYDTAEVVRKAAMFKDKKYLIAHGTADDNVHFLSAAQMINALVKEEIQFTQLIYVDENHSIGTRTHSRHLFRALTNFLVDDCWDLNAPVVTPAPATTPKPGSSAANLAPALTLLAAAGLMFILKVNV